MSGRMGPCVPTIEFGVVGFPHTRDRADRNIRTVVASRPYHEKTFGRMRPCVPTTEFRGYWYGRPADAQALVR